MKQKIKVKFIDFWSKFNPKMDPIFGKLLSSKYELEYVDNPDFLFYSGVYGKKQNYKKYPNAIKIWYSCENRKYDNEFFNDCDYSISHQIRNNKKHLRLPGFLRQFGYDRIELLNYDIDLNEIIKQKEKFCCFIYKASVPHRNNFFHKLSEYKKIDSAGTLMNNMKNKFTIQRPIYNSENEFNDFINFTKKYKFIISIEHEIVQGFTSEKIMWGMQANTIPIYYGNPMIGNDFNPESFVHFKHNDNIEDVIEQIKKLDQNDNIYKQMLNRSWFPNNEIPKKLSKEYVLNFFDEIFKK